MMANFNQSRDYRKNASLILIDNDVVAMQEDEEMVNEAPQTERNRNRKSSRN